MDRYLRHLPQLGISMGCFSPILFELRRVRSREPTLSKVKIQHVTR
jgi:hypothetical protein